ncbi:uncharacterized protein LOC118390188 isoform X2 [Oncorhynchus keta]|uniref:uncharacterized protein LOC118390188 isoform X2 n=1 Tax=Oncorhynchus keta TaxID=8018 RepID=UPI0015FB3669|nr:uncharacterized protein LOC118390188 isoform X2 [Oncorhynchus keta]
MCVKMKGYSLLCLIFLAPVTVIGQTTPDPSCVTVDDFEVCTGTAYPCNVEKSKCYCKDKKPFCRCNNYIDKWYIGEKCDFEWTILNFALVSSLPGLALVVIVGVIVQCVHYLRKPAKKQKDRTTGYTNYAMSPTTYYENNQDDMFSNTVFASDMPNQAKASQCPARPGEVSHIQLTQPPLQPSTKRHAAHFRQIVFDQPYKPAINYATGMTQPLGNPHPKSPSPRNPYEDKAPPPDCYDDQHMRPTHPPPGLKGMMREGMSGYPAPSSHAPLYSAPEYNPSSQFPRAQIGRHC